MAVSEATEARMIAERQARNKQDKKYPHLINIDDGRLLPNVPNLAKHPKYRVYHGDPKATSGERLRYLASQLGGRAAHRAVVNSQEDVAPFDVGTATKEELIAFAQTEYDLELSSNTDIRTLRKRVADAAQRAAGDDSLS